MFDLVDTPINGTLIDDPFHLVRFPFAFAHTARKPRHTFALGLRVGLQRLQQQVYRVLHLGVQILKAQSVA
jgi:hypothetical protein